MKVKIKYLIPIFFISIFLFAQNEFNQKIINIKEKLFNNDALPSAIKLINKSEDGHLFQFTYWTFRGEIEKDSVLMLVGANNLDGFLQFTELHKKNKKTKIQYSYSTNNSGIVDFAYTMKQGNDTMLFNEYNPKLNKADSSIQKIYIPKLEYSVNELYDILYNK